jgi:hypothetical protein
LGTTAGKTELSPGRYGRCLFPVHQQDRVQHGSAGNKQAESLGNFRHGQGEDTDGVEEHKEPERESCTPAIGLLLPGCEKYCNYRDYSLNENGDDLKKIRKYPSSLISFRNI